MAAQFTADFDTEKVTKPIPHRYSTIALQTSKKRFIDFCAAVPANGEKNRAV